LAKDDPNPMEVTDPTTNNDADGLIQAADDMDNQQNSNEFSETPYSGMGMGGGD